MDMELRGVWYFLTAIGICLILYLPGRFNYVGQHPTLSKDAELPSIYLRNVSYYVKEKSFDRSHYHLDRAIRSIRRIEKDVDVQSAELLEEAIVKLETIKGGLLKGSVVKVDMMNAFKFALNTLVCAELKVSERYAETNRRRMTNLALEHAQFHLKNAISFESSKDISDISQLEMKKHIFMEIDSLIENQSVSRFTVMNKIDHMLTEMDELMAIEN